MKTVKSPIYETVPTVAVIIPYFQREPGILARALGSVYAQDIGPDVQVRILVVDDESPAQAEPEILGYSRPGFSIEVIKRRNGGPGKARNTGLAAATDAAVDFIAFLDSDDLWAEQHLSTALRGLIDGGAQFFFANNQYSDDVTWFSTLTCAGELLANAEPTRDGEYTISRNSVMPLLLRECLPHTSTVVLDASRLHGLRFDETQSMAGEDYLFWVSYAQGAERVAFTTRPTAYRGRGVDIYRSKHSWDHPDCVRCLFHNLTLRKKFLSRFAQTSSDRTAQHHELALLRREIAYLFVRNAFAFWRENGWVASRILVSDPAFWLFFPFNVALSVGDRVQARLRPA